MKMGSSQWQRIRSKCRPVLRVLLHELWPASPWKTMGYTWLWLFWCVFPGTMVLKYSMDPGDHIMMIMIGGALSFMGVVVFMQKILLLLPQG